MGKRDKQSPDQADLFYQPVYASRQASDRIECLDFASRLARDMSLALRQCPYDRHEVAARMAQALGQAEFSKAMLDAYTSEAKETHQISLLRFKAFVRATAQYWLWDAVVADDGLTMLQGDEVRLAEIARVEQERAALDAHLRKLKSTPVVIKTKARDQ